MMPQHGMRTGCGSRFPIATWRTMHDLREPAGHDPGVQAPTWSSRSVSQAPKAFPAKPLLAPGGPRWIANGGAGTDHFGRWDPACTTITNAAGVAADMMAEYVFGRLPALHARHRGTASGQGRSRLACPQHGTTQGKDALDRRGLGHTGACTCQEGKGLRHARRRLALAAAIHRVGRHRGRSGRTSATFLEDADCIAVCAPLTPATRGMLGRAEIAAMAPGVLLADVSRGGIVDQAALAEALVSRPCRRRRS